MPIPLEDNFEDVLGKAQRGLGLSDSALAEKSGLTVETIQHVRAGNFDPAAAAALAPVLDLNARSLADLGTKAWQPRETPHFGGLAQFTTAFGDITVNAYLVWDEKSKEAIAFDTGGDAGGMLEALEQHGLSLKYILITHTHGDHVFDLDRLKEQTGAPAFVSSREEPLEGAEPFEPGREFTLGGLRIGTRLTWGHARGGITFVVHGLRHPVAIVGDALFAGSMGGGMVSYADALRTNRAEIFSLPDDTVVCPGHGPMTTVGEEKQHNPFFAKS